MSEKEKNNKPKKSRKIVLSLLLLLLIIISTGGYYGYTQLYLPSKTEYNVKIYGENDKLYDDLTFKKGSYINVLDENEDIIDTIDINEEDNKIVLDHEDNETRILDYWEIEEKVDEKDEFYKRDIIYFNAKPNYKNKEDFVLTFTADEKANIMSDEQKVTYLKVPYKKDTNVEDYYPEVVTSKDFKGDWTINESKINKDTEIKEDTNIEFVTYQDKNDNNIDDFTEEFTIKFETNIDEEVDDKVVGWEETVDLPTLEDKNKIFYEWYSDEEYKKEFTEETKVRSDLTLYAKVKSFDEIVNESVENPIERKDISLQVENKLEERNKPVDEAYRKEIEKAEKEREELKKYNEENNIVTQDIETEIKLHNSNHNKLHLITFLDPSNKFIYSLVAPYGQTIKVINENGNLYKEYSVRNKTSIVLDESKLVKNIDKLEKYHSEYRKINDTVFIKIQPITN